MGSRLTLLAFPSSIGDLLLSGNPEDYDYLKSSRLNVEGVDDHEEWRGLEVRRTRCATKNSLSLA